MKSKIIKHKPSTWERITGIQIIDPDGWRNDNKSFNVPISKQEWNKRMLHSTIYSSSHITSYNVK